MNLVARLTVALVVLLPACSSADARDEAAVSEVAMSGGETRVLGQRAFDSAAAGYAPLARLSAEPPRRTLSRATDRLEVLERDLTGVRVHTETGANVAELARVEQLLLRAREEIATVDGSAAIAEADLETSVESIVALVTLAQEILGDVRERRIHPRGETPAE